MTLPYPWRIGILLAALAGVWVHGYFAGAEGPERELAAARAASDALNDKYRSLERQAEEAQHGYVEAYRRNRDATRDDWLRLQAKARRRVPAVCPEPGGTEPAAGDPVEGPGGADGRDLLPAVTEALAAGEDLEATLRLCQSELRQCAALR